jgi:hypothetical protein
MGAPPRAHEEHAGAGALEHDRLVEFCGVNTVRLAFGHGRRIGDRAGEIDRSPLNACTDRLSSITRAGATIAV